MHLLSKRRLSGLNLNGLSTIFRTIVVTYAVTAWYGQLSQSVDVCFASFDHYVISRIDSSSLVISLNTSFIIFITVV